MSSDMPLLLREGAGADPPGVLADLGSGEGAMLYALDRSGFVQHRIYAVDLSEQSLALAAQLSGKVIPICSDVTHVEEISAGSVDGVTSSQVIEHLPDDKVLACEIARLLRPGGWFYVSSVIRGRRAWWFRRGNGRWQLDPTHVREYASEEEFAAALAHPELKVERVESRPLRFPVVDPVLRLAATARLVRSERLSTLYEASSRLRRARRSLQVRIPGYRWVEAFGRRL